MDNFKTLKRYNTASAKWDSVKDKVDTDDYLVFSVADSDYETAPEIKHALINRVEHGAFGYTMLDDQYYQIVTDWFERRYHVKVRRNWIVTAPKVLTALSVIIDQLTSAEASIVIQTPVYNVFYPAIENNRRTILENKLVHDAMLYTVDFDNLENHFKAGAEMLILCNPHNPVGRVFTVSEIAKMVSLCKQYNVILVSDEIHADLIMPNQTFTSAGTFIDDYKNIILVNAPSKTFNLAGLQSAHMIIPNPTHRKKIKSYMTKRFLYAPNLLAIEAIKVAYTKCDAWVEAQNKHIYHNYLLLKDKIRRHNNTIRLAPLEGTYLAWLDFSAYKLTSSQLNQHFIKYQVAVAEGPHYGSHCDGFIRINLACSNAQLKEGLKRLINALEQL